MKPKELVAPCGSSLINIPPQRGDCAQGAETNRFSGFQDHGRRGSGGKTAKAVKIYAACSTTSLKQGVNERELRRVSEAGES